MSTQTAAFQAKALGGNNNKLTFTDASCTFAVGKRTFLTDTARTQTVVIRLTDKTVAALKAPAKGNKKYRDGDLKGFACQVTAAGHRSFCLIYRIHGVEKLYVIGEFGIWPTAAARTEAARLRRLVDQGIDPKAMRDQERDAPTVKDLAQRYEEEHLPGKRPRSAKEDRALVRDYVLPALGKLKVADVTQSDVRKMHREITSSGKLYRANRALACVSTMFGLAIQLGWRVDNPCRGVKRNPEDHRERFLSPAGRW
jgi:Arm DNA-binding domain/Phage integrase, N-terminal SAM-like domain